MSVIRCKFIHWNQNKISVFDINMWNMKFQSVDDFIIIKQNVKIQSTRSPADNSFSVCSCFKFMKPVKKFFRCEKSTEFEGSVKKIILFHSTVWFCYQIFGNCLYSTVFVPEYRHQHISFCHQDLSQKRYRLYASFL